MDILSTMSLPEKLSREAQAPLARRAVAGEADAFAQLVDSYHGRVYRYLYALVKHPEDASDLTQDVFIKVYKSLERYNPDKPFEPWLFTIARRTTMSYFRKLRHEYPLSEENVENLEREASPGREVDDRSRSLWELAEQLPPKLHQVLLLHYRETFSVEEVAGIMGVTKIYTRVLLHRARTRLKEIYQRQEEFLL